MYRLIGTFLLVLAAARSVQADDAPKKVALLVGVNRYLKPGFDDLKYAEADVTAVGEALETLGFDVTLLLGGAMENDRKATKEAIEATTRKLVKPLGKRDVILLMFSGHGQTLNPDPNANPAKLEVDQFESYYCPVDAVYNTPESQVSINYLLDDVLAANVGRKLLVLDACRDIPVDRTRPGKNARGINLASIDVRKGTCVYLSCDFGQRSFEDSGLGHGLFTHCLLDGLRGGAAHEGELAWSDLVAHVNRRMRSPQIRRLMPANEQQRPFPAGDMTPTVLGRLDFGPPATFTSRIGLKMNLIPAGEFLMGSPASEESRRDHEGPQHRVRFTQPFYLGVYEVTQREWETVMGSNPSYFSKTGRGKDKVAGLDTSACPVESVSWFDAIEFCNKLSQRDGFSPHYTLAGIEQDDDGSIDSARVSISGGNGYRLPTEAEWEYACRAGTTTPFHFGTTNNGTQANIDGNYPYGTSTKGPYLERTTSGGKYAANAFGLFDMHGNVWEWCFDAFDGDAYQSRSGITPDPVITVSPEGRRVVRGDRDRRVLRGGCWYGYAWYSRSAVRDWYAPVFSGIGFRVARTQ